MKFLFIYLFTTFLYAGHTPQAFRPLSERLDWLSGERLALEELEAKYFKSAQGLQTPQKNAEAIKLKINKVLSQVSLEEFLAISKADDLTTFDKRKVTQVKKVQKEIASWTKLHQKSQSLLDEIWIRKFNYYVELNIYKMDNFLANQTVVKRSSRIEKLKRLRHEVLLRYNKYYRHLDRYGHPKDVFRLEATRQYFKASKEFYVKAADYAGLKPEAVGDLIKGFGQDMGKFVLKNSVKDTQVLEVMKKIIFADPESINVNIQKSFRSYAEHKGYDVKILNKEALKILETSDKKTINIISKVHRGPLIDFVVLSHLGLKDYVFVTSFGSEMPKVIANRLKDNAGLAFVGPGFPNGIETLISKTVNHPNRIMVNYSEGNIGNAGETRPVAKKFGTDLIPEFHKRGYKVNIIPVSSQASAFMKDDNYPIGKFIEARINQPITDEMIKVMNTVEVGIPMNIMLRSVWLENMDTSVKNGVGLIDGAPTMSLLDNLFLKYFGNSMKELNQCNLML